MTKSSVFDAPAQPRIRLDPRPHADALLCPTCDDSWLQQRSVALVRGGTESVAIGFKCEGGCPDLELVIAPYKGETYLSWRRA